MTMPATAPRSTPITAPQTEDDYQESDYQDDTCRDDQAGYADYEEYYDSEYEDCPSDYEDPAYSD